MLFDLQRVRKNVEQATTEDLVDRVTVYRAGMEESALPIIEAELAVRAVTDAQIQAHAERRRQETSIGNDGTALRCSFCQRPAVAEGWGWHRLWAIVPIFPRLYRYCAEHRPSARRGI